MSRPVSSGGQYYSMALIPTGTPGSSNIIVSFSAGPWDPHPHIVVYVFFDEFQDKRQRQKLCHYGLQ